MRKAPLPLLLAALLGLSQCKKKNPEPAEQLPLATQTGNRAFGCLVNGRVWVPKGYNGTTNYSVSYDPTYAKGTLSISAYRYGEREGDKQTIGVYSDSVTTPGIYNLNIAGRRGATFIDRLTGCNYNNRDINTFHRCTLTITRLDKQVGIISGTFAFTLYKPGCDSIRVTDGRFDYQL